MVLPTRLLFLSSRLICKSMGETVRLRQRSAKTVKNLNDVVGEKKFILPISKANDVSPDGLPSVMVQINLKKTYIPCGVGVNIPNDVFSVMKDAGIVSGNETYEVGGPFDPVRNYAQR